MSCLPDKYRVAIVLCDLEGRTRKEAARHLGLPEGTLSGHLTRGRAMLAKRLTRHGLTASDGILTAFLSQKVVSAGVPASLVSSTMKAASVLAAGKASTTGVISTRVAALMKGVLKTMLFTKHKIVSVVLLLVLLGGVGSGGFFYCTQAADVPKAPQADKHAAGTKDKLKKEKPKDDTVAIRGVWRVVSVKHGNTDKAEEEAEMWKESRWVIKAKTIDIRAAGGDVGFVYLMDPSKYPGALELRLLGTAYQAVYALEGDSLKIRMGGRGESRPKGLAEKDLGNTVLLTLKREFAAADDASIEIEQLREENNALRNKIKRLEERLLERETKEKP